MMDKRLNVRGVSWGKKCLIGTVSFKLQDMTIYVQCFEANLGPCVYNWEVLLYGRWTFFAKYFSSYIDAESWLKSSGYL